MRGAFVGNGEQTSSAEQRLRQYGRSSRNYFLISLAFIVLAFVDYGIEVGFHVQGWGVLLFSVIRMRNPSLFAKLAVPLRLS